MKQTLFFFAVLSLVSLNAYAEFDNSDNVNVDGIFYYLDNDNGQAQVVSMPEGRYSGDIFIPSFINHNNKKYSVTSIGEYAFCWCKNLLSVTIPSSVSSIAKAIFWGSNNLSVIKVVSGNPRYDSRNNCNAIIETESNCLVAGCKNTEIPNSVTAIGDDAFNECLELSSITIPNSVTTIGKTVFKGCKDLVSVIIPESVTNIGYNPFWACTSLSSIKVAIGNPKYDSRNNCNAIIETENNKLISGCKNTIIPNSVISIEHGAFCGCVGLTSIMIPNSVETIGTQAFMDCITLTSANIPNSVKDIGTFAFNGCYKLTSVTIGNNVNIGKFAFGEYTKVMRR